MKELITKEKLCRVIWNNSYTADNLMGSEKMAVDATYNWLLSLTPQDGKGKEVDGMTLIKTERIRQIEKEGYTDTHDSQYEDSELFNAGLCYYNEKREYKQDSEIPLAWPWRWDFWKPTPNDRVRELVKAGALFMAQNELSESYIAESMVYACAHKIDELLTASQFAPTGVEVDWEKRVKDAYVDGSTSQLNNTHVSAEEYYNKNYKNKEQC